MRVFGATILLSAFLLFQVQPLIGKIILPWFGSSPAVWSACMLFFQALLLGGYTYAHVSVSILPRQIQAVLHVGLLLAAAGTLPIMPQRPEEVLSDNPTWQIMSLLSRSVGLPYLLLSASGPLFQAWFSARFPGRAPYRLYALSNVGSLVALLSYPLLVEPTTRLVTQTWLWSGGFIALVAAAAGCAWMMFGSAEEHPSPAVPTADDLASPTPRPDLRMMAAWTLYAMTGTTILLAITNEMCQDVAVVPFLWILPLTAYLLSFIFCFESDRWYRRIPFLLYTVAGTIAATMLLMDVWTVSLGKQIALYVSLCFSACMCCHGELALLRPTPRWLTLYYLMIAVGGVLGGFLVAIIAPLIFLRFWEFDLALATTCLLTWLNLVREQRAQATARALDARSTRATRRRQGNAPTRSDVALPTKPFLDVAGLIGIAVLIADACLGWHMYHEHRSVVRVERNFYGVLSVQIVGAKPMREAGGYSPGTLDVTDLAVGLYNSRILHGLQYRVDEERRLKPTLYYTERSGVGLAIENHPTRSTQGEPFRIGVIGLGVGTLACYARRGDYVRFYEINPAVIRLAEGANVPEDLFTYMRDARERGAIVETVQGDARRLMAQEAESGQPGEFHVLAVDAFNGDAIPTHLITKECMELYLQHMAPQGIMAMHVSNLYLDLSRVVRRIADELSLSSVFIVAHKDLKMRTGGSRWVLVSRQVDLERLAADWPEYVPWKLANIREGPLWTDDFSSIIPIMVPESAQP